MSDSAESEFWERQHQEELQALIDEANSLGLSVIDVTTEATAGYRALKQAGLSRGLVEELDIRSELDFTITALKTAIQRAKTS